MSATDVSEVLTIGGFAMYPMLITGIILIVASIRYAIDSEPIRLRFIIATSLVLFFILSSATVIGIITSFSQYYTAEPKFLAIAGGLAKLLNLWGLFFYELLLAAIAIAIGIYRVGRRQLKALKP
jgi:uncharacterized protein (DUF486 family)